MRRPLSELVWIAPFALMCLLAAALFRPEAEAGLPVLSGKTVTIADAAGNRVEVPSPPVAVAESLGLRLHLQSTQKPELLLRIGNDKDREGFATTALSWVFPEVLKGDRYWGRDVRPLTFESLLAEDCPGCLYFFPSGAFDHTAAELRDRFGVLAVSYFPYDTSAPGVPVDPSWMKTTNIDEVEYAIFTIVRVVNAAIGNAAFGETLIADFLEECRLLHDEFLPETIPENERPRVAGVGASPDDWANLYIGSGDDERTAVRSALGEYRARGRYSEAERVLAIDPDAISVGNPAEFRSDSRWRGLTAVREGRLYTGNPDFGTYNWDIDHRLLNARLRAELYHPERYEAGVLRERIRELYRKRYNYEITEDQIDILLSVPENAAAAGYERFTRRKR
jgi:hypothetical protein